MKTVLLVLLLTVAGCSSGGPRTAAAPRTVEAETAPVEAREIPDTVQAVGTVEPVSEAVVSARITGEVTDLRIHEGMRVSRGDTLLVIDAPGIKAGRDAAVQTRAQAAAGVKEAAAALDNVSINLGRMRSLYEDRAVSKKELDDMEARGRMAAARLERARAGVARADAAAAEAEVMLGYSVVRSPLSGVVTEKMISEGETTAPGMPLARVVDDGRMRLKVQVNESRVSGLDTGERVMVGIDALGGGELEGRVEEIVPSADPATRSSTVRIALPRTGGLLPGMFGRAYLPVGARRAVFLPDGALAGTDGAPGVFVAGQDGLLSFRAVRLVRGRNGPPEVISGLEGGERVVVGPHGGLAAGMRVVSPTDNP